MVLSKTKHPLLLLATVVISLSAAWKKPKSWCFKEYSDCMTNSAEGTTTPWEPCHLRCVCLGWEYGQCEKECHGEVDYPYTCVCRGFGRNRRRPLPRECFIEDNLFDKENRRKSDSMKGIFPGKLEPPFD